MDPIIVTADNEKQNIVSDRYIPSGKVSSTPIQDIGGMVGIGSSILQGISNLWTNKLNLDFQRENLDYQKAMQRESWYREDTASQRKVADLKAAGLNPMLATGMQAQSSSPIKTEAPQLKSPDVFQKVSEGMFAYMQLLGQKSQIEKTQAETNRINTLTNLEADKIILDNELKTFEANKNKYREKYMNEMTYFEYVKEMYGADIAYYTSQLRMKEDYFRQEMNRLEISDKEIENQITELEKSKLTKDLSLKDKELLAKDIEIEERKRNISIYKRYGQPSDQTLGSNSWMSTVMRGGGLLQSDILQELGSKLNLTN